MIHKVRHVYLKKGGFVIAVFLVISIIWLYSPHKLEQFCNMHQVQQIRVMNLGKPSTDMVRMTLTNNQEEALSQLFLNQYYRRRLVQYSSSISNNNVQRLFIVLEGKNQFNEEVYCVLGVDSIGNVSLSAARLNRQIRVAVPFTKKDGLRFYSQIVDIVE